MLNQTHRIGVLVYLLGSFAIAQPADPAKVGLDQQAQEMVKSLRFVDDEKTAHVTRLTANYLQQLQVLLGQRTEMLAKEGNGEASEINTQTATAYRVSRNSTVALRDAFVSHLNALMPPDLVDRIKDGVTGDWLHITRQRYEDMVPGMTYAQKAHIHGLLVEMRENAMMELGVGPQEKWVAKYRGIINNYISKQGYDFPSLAKAYDEKNGKKQD